MTRKFAGGLTVLGGFLLACTASGQQIAENKDVVLRQHALWSQGDLSVVDELYTSDFVCHFLVGPEWRGRQGVRDQVTAHRTAFPDWTEEVEDIVAENDRVVTRFRSSGTHRGEFAGIPATGRRVEISEVAIYRLVDGQIAEQWGFPDITGLLSQLQGSSEAPKQ
jgi:steroid delta-isomerase-like uncharacterized protein